MKRLSKVKREHRELVREVPELNRDSCYGYVKFVRPELERGAFWPCAYGLHGRCTAEHYMGKCTCGCHAISSN